MEYVLVLMNRPPSYGSNSTTALWSPNGLERLRDSILKEKTGVKPRRRICDQTDTLPAASAAELVPNVLGFLSFGAYQQCREGDPDAWATQVLHIICPGLHYGEDTPVSSHGVSTTQEAAVTSYKPYCLNGVEQGIRGCF